MITRREFLTALAGAAALGSATAYPAFADHKNDGTPLSRTMDRVRDGSGDGTPDGHPQNHGEQSLRTEGAPVLGGAGATVGAQRRGGNGGNGGTGPRMNSMRPAGAGTGTGPGTGTGVCDGTGPGQ